MPEINASSGVAYALGVILIGFLFEIGVLTANKLWERLAKRNDL